MLQLSQPCARGAHRHPPNEQHPTNVGRIYPRQIHISENVHPPTLCPKGTQTPPNLDIFCQQLWPQLLAEYIQVGGCLCALRAQGSEICICIGYILPTFVGCCSFRGCLCALRAQGWIMYIFLDVFLLDIFCQHLWGVVHIITGFEHRTSARKTIARPHNYMF